MSVKVCSPFVAPTSPKIGLKNNKKRPFALLRTPTKIAETKFIFPTIGANSAAENMIGTASAGSTISAVSRVAATVETNNSNNQLTAQQR